MVWKSNNLKDFKELYFSELSGIYNENEIRTIFHLVTEYYLPISKIELRTRWHEIKLNESEILTIHKTLKRLKFEEPIQYILGETTFCDLKLCVNPSVLIPRPETEELVHWIKSKYKLTEIHHILDVGTGSGAIALALKKHFNLAKVYAVDVSEPALQIAEQNAAQNNLLINFQKLNILEQNLPDNWPKIDIIISNPPYVTEWEIKEIKNNVLKFEPHLALFVQHHDSLLFYKKIVETGLKNGCKAFYFEVNQYSKAAWQNYVDSLPLKSYEFKTDINKNFRMVKLIFA